MKKKAVLVVGWNRPNYLRTCCASIARCKALDQFDVFVSLDGETEIDPAFIKNQYQWNVIQQPHRYQIRGNLMNSLRYLFGNDYECVFYLEEDFIVRSDVLNYVASLNDRWHFAYPVCRYETEIKEAQCYPSNGNVMFRGVFTELDLYIASGKWKGKPWPTREPVCIPDDWLGHDCVFWKFMQERSMSCYFADNNYSLHFGINGTHSLDEEGMEKQFFEGPEERWIENILRVFKLKWHHIFRPHQFDYV